MINKNRGFASGLALGRRWINRVSTKLPRGFFLHEDLLPVLLDDLAVLLFIDGTKSASSRST